MVARIALAFAAVIVSLAFGEVALRILTPFPIDYNTNREPDPELGYVLNRSLEDVDRHGFRNADAPVRGGEIAAIGDSHTYGLNVGSWQSWPALLAERTGKKVYNYGVPSYTPFQYYRLLEMAAQDGAKTILIGLLLQLDVGSDLEIPCRSLETPTVRAFGQTLAADFEQRCKREAPSPKKGKGQLLLKSVKRFLKSDLAITSALYYLVYHRLAYYVLASSDRPSNRFFEDDSGWRYRAVNSMKLEMADVETRKRWLRQVLTAMDDRCRRHDVRCGYLLIPSIGRAIHTVASEGGLRAVDVEVLDEELALVDEVERLLDAREIPYVDTAPYIGRRFLAGLERGDVYEIVIPWDHHPLAGGYAAYADAAFDLIQRMEAPAR
jgi:hypothetical protein